jgi:hypothetical protein
MIKVVALSCAGTVTYREQRNGKNKFTEPFRYGLRSFFEGCKRRGIEVVFTSRHPSWEVQSELAAHIRENPADNGWLKMGKMISGYYTADGTPKDFSRVLEEQNIAPEELFVIGSNIERDIKGALKVGANFQIVRPYLTPYDWGTLGYGVPDGFGSIINKHIRLFGEIEPKVKRTTDYGIHLPASAVA